MDWIERVESPGPNPIEPGADRLVVSLVGPPNVGLRLRAPVEVTGMYGVQRRPRELWLQLDRASEFREALRTALASPIVQPRS